ncbi:MAG: hypothetical protein QJT81_17635 [Candidatus Thiothrix putei]|uniref:Uncharacterized protein n=1 Tax=Candidatus Thiothrix putei TaxID=3080811 RepID=A0AA95KLB2_9GAMM|nr:MAG: hypothetical protein QJT81_17635 [Candidatus Thiothrix putei]
MLKIEQLSLSDFASRSFISSANQVGNSQYGSIRLSPGKVVESISLDLTMYDLENLNNTKIKSKVEQEVYTANLAPLTTDSEPSVSGMPGETGGTETPPDGSVITPANPNMPILMNWGAGGE